MLTLHVSDSSSCAQWAHILECPALKFECMSNQYVNTSKSEEIWLCLHGPYVNEHYPRELEDFFPCER